MGWVNDALNELAVGRSVQVRPFGGSMRGRIESGQLVTLTLVGPALIGTYSRLPERTLVGTPMSVRSDEKVKNAALT